MQTSSTKNLRVRSSTGKFQNQSPSPKKKFDHKKQIEATLNQLHQLQAQIYSLNVPQNPHSSGPIKKQIKQLSYLYENMTRPKVKNKLNVQTKDIKSALKVINEGISAIEMKINKRIPHKKQQKEALTKPVEINLLKEFAPVVKKSEQQSQSSTKISSKCIKQLMKEMFHNDFDLSLVSETKSKVIEITADEIEKFINYNQHDQFDPLEEAYNCLLDDKGKFNFKRFNEINSMSGLPKIKEVGTLKAAFGLQQNQQMSFQLFKRVISEAEQLGFV